MSVPTKTRATPSLVWAGILLAVLGISTSLLAFSGAASGGSGNNTAPAGSDQIAFDASAIGNSTGSVASLPSTPLIMTNTELIVVASMSQGGFVTSISDSFSDTFTPGITASINAFPQQTMEFWSGFYTGATGATNIVTVNWNLTASNMFLVATYKNAVAVGNSTSASGAGTVSFSIETKKSGSWIVGGSSIPGIAAGTPGGSCAAVAPTPGTGLTQRVAGCSVVEAGSPPGFATNGDIEDNRTVLPNNNFFTYSETAAPLESSSSMLLAAIEIIGVDKEPQNPNFNNFCTMTNGLCVTTQYAINAVKQTTGANALNKALALGTAYCTGITTSAITIGTHLLVGWANYGGVALNTTGAKLQVQFYVSTNAPSTTFGSGLCATGGTIIGVGYIYFSISGALSATNAFTVSINGNCPVGNAATCTSGTYYGWIEITAQNFALGSLGFDQVTNQAYSQSSIDLMEIK